jgi:membrane protease YdiL (CAAX protease family)
MPSLASSRAVAGVGRLAGPRGAATFWLLHQTAAWSRDLPAPSWRIVILTMLVAPVVEELAFRGAVQGFCRATLARLHVRDTGLVSLSNLLTSVAFAACHLREQPAEVAWAIVLPSLLLGRLREVSNSVWACVLMHAWFNLCFLAVSASATR